MTSEVLDAEVGMSFSAAGKAYYVNVPQERNEAKEWIHTNCLGKLRRKNWTKH